MNTKYVKHFLELVERNISVQDNSSESNQPNGFAKQRLLRFTGLLVLPVVGIFYVLHVTHPKTTIISPVAKAQHVHSAPNVASRLISMIPNYRIASTRQILHAVSLRKADIAFVENVDESIAAMPVMDKVLVIPKSFG